MTLMQCLSDRKAEYFEFMYVYVKTTSDSKILTSLRPKFTLQDNIWR